MKHQYFQDLNEPDIILAVEMDGSTDTTGYMAEGTTVGHRHLSQHYLRNRCNRISRKAAQKINKELFKVLKSNG